MEKQVELVFTKDGQDTVWTGKAAVEKFGTLNMSKMGADLMLAGAPCVADGGEYTIRNYPNPFNL